MIGPSMTDPTAPDPNGAAADPGPSDHQEARADAVAERGLTFVIPAYNEEASLHRMVAAVHEAGRDLMALGEVDEYEIVVVDDASTDATPRICDQLAADDPRFVVIHHPVNRKLGGSLRTGFAAARGRWVLYTDADLPFDLWDLRKAFRLMRYYEADVVTAFRFSRTGEGLQRLLYSYVYNAMLRMRFGLKVRDVNFAAKLMNREVLDTVNLSSEGSFIDAELLIRAEAAGFRVIQFGVDYFPRSRGVSTLSSPAVIRTLLREMNALGPELKGPFR
jgi:glycosyltransferase involved in cell wall biosynthesis